MSRLVTESFIHWYRARYSRKESWVSFTELSEAVIFFFGNSTTSHSLDRIVTLRDFSSVLFRSFAD